METRSKKSSLIESVRRLFHLTTPMDKQFLRSNTLAPPYVESNSEYEIKIINRGEQLSYEDANGRLVVEISIYGEWIDAGSIKQWGGKPITREKHNQILSRIKQYFVSKQGADFSVINQDKSFE